MNTTSERLNELFYLHVAEKTTDLEQLELWSYIDDPLYAHQIDELLSRTFLAQHQEHSLDEMQAEGMLKQIFKSSEESKPIAKTGKLWARIGVAAAIATIIFSTGIWFYKANQTDNYNQAAMEQIAPGKQGATLTLANGKKIRLTDAKDGDLAKEAGVTITKSSDGQLLYNISDTESTSSNSKLPQYNTLSTGNGETYQVKLPDGSLVFLNAASSLTYQSSLANNPERRVELQGEAYFEIAKVYRPLTNGNTESKLVPFIVATARQEVKVLGTKFNINSYVDEKEVKTTLLEGSVQVSVNDDLAGTLLKPNQASSLAENNKLTVQNVNATDAIAWKNGFFKFEDASVEAVLRQLARWYDVEIVYTGKMPYRLFTGEIYRNLSFGEALKIIGFAKVKFKIQGKTIIVSP